MSSTVVCQSGHKSKSIERYLLAIRIRAMLFAWMYHGYWNLPLLHRNWFAPISVPIADRMHLDRDQAPPLQSMSSLLSMVVSDVSKTQTTGLEWTLVDKTLYSFGTRPSLLPLVAPSPAQMSTLGVYADPSSSNCLVFVDNAYSDSSDPPITPVHSLFSPSAALETSAKNLTYTFQPHEQRSFFYIYLMALYCRKRATQTTQLTLQSIPLEWIPTRPWIQATEWLCAVGFTSWTVVPDPSRRCDVVWRRRGGGDGAGTTLQQVQTDLLRQWVAGCCAKRFVCTMDVSPKLFSVDEWIRVARFLSAWYTQEHERQSRFALWPGFSSISMNS